MGFCCYKKIIPLLVLSLLLQVFSPAIIFASSRILWPSEMNLNNEFYDMDDYIATTTTAKETKKGFLFTGDAREVFTMGLGHIAINLTLSGKGHTYLQFLDGFKKRGMKITIILVNDKPTVGMNPKQAPPDYQNPYFYMMDFYSNNADWQKFNFKRILDDYGKYADNWVIGNEINSQLYNFYGPSTVEEYTKVYCDTFKEMYKMIKEKNKDANCFISFDQGWDMPQHHKFSKHYNKELSKYRYNAREQIDLINRYLGKNIDWGVSLHPYPAPVESAIFWDDEYAGFDEKAVNEKERPYLITAKNMEVALAYIAQDKFLYKGKDKRKIIVSELAFTSHDGEEIQAAGLYFIWQKIVKYDEIVALLYNAQTDLADGYNFGLTSDKNKKRLAWAVFKDMDNYEVNAWCKDLLDRILDEHDFVVEDTILISKASLSEILKGVKK